MPLNPFKLKAARKKLEEAGVSVGDRVTVTWALTSVSGDLNAEASHTGVLSEADDWIRIEGSDKTPGYLHIPLTGLLHVELAAVGESQET